MVTVFGPQAMIGGVVASSEAEVARANPSKKSKGPCSMAARQIALVQPLPSSSQTA
jgi:hypothetical protein